MELGKKFDQESVAHSVGMLYTTGKNANKMEPTKGQVVTDQDLNNFFSTIQTGDGPKKYQVVYEFGNFVDIPKSVDAKRAGQNVNYGEEIANDNDVMLSNDGPIQRPPRQEETDTFESRSRSVFDVASLVERAATADPSVRPEGEFIQRQYTPFQLFKNLAYKRFVDKFGDILNLQEDVESFLGRRVASNQDFKSVEQLMYGKAAQDLERLEKKIEAITSKMKELGINSGEMTDYLYALHAPERNKLILEREGVENGSGLSDADAKEILDDLTSERKAELETCETDAAGY